MKILDGRVLEGRFELPCPAGSGPAGGGALLGEADLDLPAQDLGSRLFDGATSFSWMLVTKNPWPLPKKTSSSGCP